MDINVKLKIGLLLTSRSLALVLGQVMLSSSISLYLIYNVDTVCRLAGKSLLKIIKRWPSTISKCIFSLSENLRDPNSPEHAVLGSCAILTSKTVLKHLSTVVIRDHMLKKDFGK